MGVFRGILHYAFVAVVALVGAEEEHTDLHVIALTSDAFDSFLEKNPVSLIEFYAPWCGHCKKLAPQFDEAAGILKEDKIILAKVDATAESDLAQRFGVRGYPTLKLFRNKEAEEYNGGRKADQIVEWMRKMTGPAVDVVASMEDALKMLETHAVGYIAHLKAGGDDATLFKKVADSQRKLGRFIIIEGDDAPRKLYAKRKDEESVEMSGDIVEDEVLKFINNEHFPLVGPISGENYQKYNERDQDLVWFCSDEATFNTNADSLRVVATPYRSTHSFVWLDSEKFGSHAEGALGLSEFPGLVVQSKEGRYVYPNKSFSLKEIETFMVDALGGKIEKSLKSEAIPETNDESVKVIVGKNFEAMVLDDKKDVLLEVYAPWCGHCKKLEPIYKEVAEKLIDNDHLTIAKMDGTGNESPVSGFDWSGFPTIFFVPKGTKTPKRFDGARTVEGIIEYLKTNSSKELKIKEIIEKIEDTEETDKEADKEEL